MALVENHRSDSISAKHVQSLPCSVAEQIPELEIAVLRASDLPFERSGDSSDLTLASGRRLSRPAARLMLHRLARLPRRLRSIPRPPALREIAECNRRIVETGKSLIGQTRDSRAGISRGKPVLSTEFRSRSEPLRLNGRVRASTSARSPSRRTISMPSSVLPEPGGATMCVRRRPCRRSSSNASRASTW